MTLPPLSPAIPNRLSSFSVPTNWGISNPARFLELMREAITLVAPGSYFGDNLFTWCRNNSLFDDAAFIKSWEANIQNDADKAIAWRRYILACSAYHCIQCSGDFVECGVYRGSGVKTVIDYLGATAFPKNFWAYDTFDYNPVPGNAFKHQKAGLFEAVKDRFAAYPQVKLIAGLIPGTFKDNSPEKIAYLHIDLNDVDSEVATLDCLFDRVVTGGIIILDDYEWAGAYRPQKLAEDAWFERRNYRVMPLPTGQGLVIKR